MSTRHSEPRGWLLVPYEGQQEQTPAIFRRWIECGDRSDYAVVDFRPPLEPTATGVSEPLAQGIVAPRHEGDNLKNKRDRWPIHVYVLSAPSELQDADVVPPDALRIRLWALLTEELDDQHH